MQSIIVFIMLLCKLKSNYVTKNERKMIVSLYIYDFGNAYMKQLCYEILVLEIMKRYKDILRKVEQNKITKC